METPSPPATSPARELESIANELISRSYRPSTILNYQNNVQKFAFFLEELGASRIMPVPAYYVALYIAKLSKEGYAPGTIKAALSAISWFHRMSNVPDPTSAPYLQRMILGSKLNAPPPRKLLPITRPILYLMLDRVNSLVLSTYQHILVKALLLLAYHSCARVGELLVSSNADHTIRLKNVAIKNAQRNPTIRIELPSYKHSKEATFFQLKMFKDPSRRPVKHLCAFDFLQKKQCQTYLLVIPMLNMPLSQI